MTAGGGKAKSSVRRPARRAAAPPPPDPAPEAGPAATTDQPPAATGDGAAPAATEAIPAEQPPPAPAPAEPAGPPQAVRLRPPALPHGLTVEEGFARIAAGLLEATRSNIPVAADGTDIEGVHQLRVALRRLRSALSLFAPALGEAAVAHPRAEVKWLAGTLGPARDWDVFLTETLPSATAALADDPRLRLLAPPAAARRETAYAAARRALASRRAARLLDGLDARIARRFQHRGGNAEERALRAAPLAAFAADTLTARLKRVAKGGRHFKRLHTAELHRLRLRAKRLRYAAEFFAPLFDAAEARRFIRRLAALQEALGHLQDGVVAGALLADLAPAGPSPSGVDGAARAWAAGAVQGFVAGRGADARARDAWRRFRDCPPFWR